MEEIVKYMNSFGRIYYLIFTGKWAREEIERDLKNRIYLRLLEEFTYKLRNLGEILPTQFPSTVFLSCSVKQNVV